LNIFSVYVATLKTSKAVDLYRFFVFAGLFLCV
jgi:hypothetical protein